MYIWIEDHLLVIVAVLAAVELFYIAAQLVFAIAITHPPYRGASLWYIAAVFALARRAAIVELVMRLFPITTPKKREDRLKSLWRLWHRVHLPPYAARVCRLWPARQRRVIECTFLGLKAAVSRALERAEQPSEAGSRLSFDEFWPILECIEELAVHTHPLNQTAFADGLADLATSINDETVQAQVGWLVNELLERTEPERALGLAVGRSLLKSDAVASHEALRTLIEYKRLKHEDEASEQASTSEKLDPYIEKLAEDSGVPQLLTPTTSAFTASCDARRDEVLRVDAREIARQVQTIATEVTTQVGVEQKTVIGKAMEIAALTDPLLKSGHLRSGVHGIVSLAALRLVLRRVCVSVREPDAPSKAAIEPSSTSILIRGVCDALMARRADDSAGFIIIEAIESIRDERPGDAADAMARFLGKAAGQLDPGIAVCICEGVEDHLTKIEPAQRAESVRHVRFRRRRGSWRSADSKGLLGGIETFWTLVTASLQGPADDVAHWMNGRLGLRT